MGGSTVIYGNYFAFISLVVVGPNIDTPPLSVSVPNPQTVTLTCEASGFPVPNITWLHDGVEVSKKL